MQCDPPLEEFDHAVEICRNTFSAVGANVTLGASLRRIFLEKGLADVKVSLCLHAQTSTDPMTMHVPLTLAAMRDAIVANGLMRGDELDALITRVADHLARPDTMTITFTMTQIIAHAPT